MIKLAVVRLQIKLADRFKVILINIHSEFGISLSRKYLTRAVPSFLIFDSSGKEVERFHKVPEYEFLLNVSRKMSNR